MVKYSQNKEETVLFQARRLGRHVYRVKYVKSRAKCLLNKLGKNKRHAKSNSEYENVLCIVYKIEIIDYSYSVRKMVSKVSG